MTIWETIFLFNTITRHSERSEESTTKDAKPSGGYRLLRSRPPREGMVKPDLWKGLLLMLFPRLSFNGCRRISIANKAARHGQMETKPLQRKFTSVK